MAEHLLGGSGWCLACGAGRHGKIEGPCSPPPPPVLGPRTVGELVQALLALPQDMPVGGDYEGDPRPLGPVVVRQVVVTPRGFQEYLSTWEGLCNICLDCGTRHCTREGHRVRRDVPVVPVPTAIVEAE